MKKLFIISMTLMLVAGFYTISFSQITGSAHDLSSRGWVPDQQICVVCHTPHNAMIDPPYLIWNHEYVPDGESWTMYSGMPLSGGNSLDGAISAEPRGISKLCLGCHDGSIALDAFGGNPGGTEFISGPYDLVLNPDATSHVMQHNHPISVEYDNEADQELADPATTQIGTSGTIAEVLEIIADVGAAVQCSSCHDVHNSVFETIGPPLLRETLNQSQLCLTCHTK